MNPFRKKTLTGMSRTCGGAAKIGPADLSDVLSTICPVHDPNLLVGFETSDDGSAQCEADIKAETQATIRNIPFGFEQAPGVPCIKCGQPATVTAWFAKAY